MLEFRDLELVHAIAAHGNFTRAARALSIGQPVLTRRLADLEHRLGGLLFLRQRSGAEPTNICRTLLDSSKLIVEQFQGLERHLMEARGRQSSDLRVAAGGFAAETSVLAAVAAMLRDHADVRLHLTSSNWVDALYAVRERDVELGIFELSGLGEDTADLIIEPLLQHPAFFATRADHPLVARPGLTLPEILSYPLVFLGKSSARVVGPFAVAREAAQATGSMHPSFPALVHESPSAALRVVLESDAVSVVTAPIANLALRSGDIMILPWCEPWFVTNFGIVQVRGRQVSDAAARFVELLREADATAFGAGQALLACVNANKHGLGVRTVAWSPDPPQGTNSPLASTSNRLPTQRA